MKKYFYSLFLLVAFFKTIVVQANTITVKGYAQLTNGSPSKNTNINIAVYLGSATTSCSEQVTVTNGDGFYSKELTCSGGDIRKARISLKNCDGQVITVEKEVPTSKVVEVNFTICQATPVLCAAGFSFESIMASSTVSAFSVKFNSNTSQVTSGDNIASRNWNFRDGSALLADRVDPTHTFPHGGTYEVCLTIKTASGCESKICKPVTVATVVAPTCAAKFTFEKLGPKKFRFNSSSSTVTLEDNIIERKWDFNDGTTSSDISPAHEFPRFGTYEVCLSIKTAKGCESKLCTSVKLDEGTTTNDNPINIVSLYPIPVHENLKTVIYCRNNNIVANISIVNVDGITQPIQQVVTLSQGNNPLTINVYKLAPGSYFYKIKTQFGTLSKPFYKL